MAVIVAAKRSAIVPRGGALATLEIEDIAAPVIAALCAHISLPIDEIICANALGAGGNIARIIALAAGLPHLAGLTVDRQCAGGLDAILLARALVDSGAARVVIAGGAESYSRRPMRSRDGVRYDQARFAPKGWDDPDMADAADALAQEFGISRVAQDAWAVQSHARVRISDGEIVPILGVGRDPFARGLSMPVAARAKVISGSITAANAAVAADGAAFVVVVADDVAKAGLQIMAGASRGGDVTRPGIAPLAAIDAVGREDIEMAEIMEAYAVQAMICSQGFDRVNVGGGALARGHAIGASGAVLAVRLFYELGTGDGLAAIAAAGGIATAMRVRRI